MITIYTDGSTRNNGSKNAVGAFAYAILEDDRLMYDYSQVLEGKATNQIAELTAPIHALEWLYSHMPFDINPVIVYSDSAYLIRCYDEMWWTRWIKNGWINSQKQPVANRDLWEKLIPYFMNKNIQWKKCKGHSDNFWNNYVDNLAQQESKNAHCSS